MQEILNQYLIIHILAALALLGLVAALYLLWARPYQLTWGAIEEEIQRPMPGDEVPISAIHSMAFYAIEPDEYLIWVGEGDKAPGRFTWALYPISENRTRLVSRIRWSYHFDEPGSVLMAVFTDFADHIAVREILRGIKGRVEGQIEPMARQNLEFFVYVAAFGGFAYALVALILRPLSWATLLTGLGAGLVWMVTWYAPISAWISLLLIAATVWRLRALSTG